MLFNLEYWVICIFKNSWQTCNATYQEQGSTENWTVLWLRIRIHQKLSQWKKIDYFFGGRIRNFLKSRIRIQNTAEDDTVYLGSTGRGVSSGVMYCLAKSAPRNRTSLVFNVADYVAGGKGTQQTDREDKCISVTYVYYKITKAW
jgi:hypothetical protein